MCLKQSFILLFFLLWVMPSVVEASAVRLAPIPVELPDRDQAGLVTLANEDSEPVNFQIRAFRWVQEGGEDKLESTDQLVVSPPVFSIPGKTSFNIRVVRTHPGPVNGEETYRLLIDQLPKPVDSRKFGAGISMLIRSSLPVFIVNADAMADMHARVLSLDGKVYVDVTNRGNRHALMTAMTLTDKVSHKTIKLPVDLRGSGYVSAGATKRYVVKTAGLGRTDWSKYTVQAQIAGKFVPLGN